MTIIHEYFPQEYIELQKELLTGYHPKLEKILTTNGGTADDVDLKLAQIAAYCSVILDGVYTLEERMRLCDILRKRLQYMRENPNKELVLIEQKRLM